MATLIDTKHPKYADAKADWQQINDICDGENLKPYLVEINPKDKSEDNKQRNNQFFDRAVFYAIAGYTARGMNGLIFNKWPKVKVPGTLEYITNNVDGSGISIYQQSQQVAKDLIRNGRAGLWVDFPNTQREDGSTGVTIADIRDRKAFATIQSFEPWQIYNWETITIGAQTKHSLIVLFDKELRRQHGGYQLETVEIIIELFLADPTVEEGEKPNPDNFVYHVRKWENGTAGWVVAAEFIPRNSAGQPWTEIPFIFAGSETNTSSIDKPPMQDIVRINVGHYNNSAIYEDSVFSCGQVQPWIQGLTLDQAEQLRAKGFYWGSGVVLPVPAGGAVGIEQAQPNTLAKEAMNDKVEMAVGLGAMFIQPGSAVKTAQQAEGEQRTQHSVLSLIASNLSEAYTNALAWMQQYMGGAGEVEYSASQEFVDPQATSQDLQVVVASMLQGALPWADYVRWTQKHGYIDPEKTPEQVAEEVQQTREPMPDLEDEDV